MKDIDIRFLAMIAAVANVLQKYESVWTTLERFATEAAKFLGLKRLPKSSSPWLPD